MDSPTVDAARSLGSIRSIRSYKAEIAEMIQWCEVLGANPIDVMRTHHASRRLMINCTPHRKGYVHMFFFPQHAQSDDASRPRSCSCRTRRPGILLTRQTSRDKGIADRMVIERALGEFRRKCAVTVRHRSRGAQTRVRSRSSTRRRCASRSNQETLDHRRDSALGSTRRWKRLVSQQGTGAEGATALETLRQKGPRHATSGKWLRRGPPTG